MATLIFLPSFAPMIIIATILLYFLCLLGLSWLTNRKADNRDFFNARHSSPWPMVAFGMIGARVGAGPRARPRSDTTNTTWTPALSFFPTATLTNTMMLILLSFRHF